MESKSFLTARQFAALLAAAPALLQLAREQAATIEILRANIATIAEKLGPLQQGERNGAAMGMASQARDIARAALEPQS